MGSFYSISLQRSSFRSWYFDLLTFRCFILIWLLKGWGTPCATFVFGWANILKFNFLSKMLFSNGIYQYFLCFPINYSSCIFIYPLFTILYEIVIILACFLAKYKFFWFFRLFNNLILFKLNINILTIYSTHYK